MKKIIDNKSSSETIDQIRSMQLLIDFQKYLPSILNISEKQIKEFAELKEEMEILYLPDKFNEAFSKQGWIIYESFSIEILKKSLEIFNSSGIDAAEDFIVNSFDEKTIATGLKRFKSNEVFRKRLRLLELAKKDYLEERYHSSILLILAIIDGLVNDVSKRVGFFADKSEMSAFDSMAGHETGLVMLSKLFSIGRNKTNEQQISIPYRNGIMHGRELSFDNKIVAAKCWSSLFAVRDWADACQKKNIEEIKETTLSDTLKIIEENHKLRQALDSWAPRDMKEFTEEHLINGFNDNSPEAVLQKFMESWKMERYGLMAEVLLDYIKKPKGKFSLEVKNDFSSCKVVDFKIKKVKDESAAISVVDLYVEAMKDGVERRCTIKIRISYCDENNRPAIRDFESGSWKIVQNGFSELIYR